MVTISLTSARAKLDRLLDKVTAGEEIVITRRGHPVARLIAIKYPVPDLSDFRAQFPPLRKPSHVLIREMRDQEG